MAAKKTNFLFCKNSHMTKIWKTPFPKEFFNKIELKVREQKYIHIFETKFEKVTVSKWQPKQVLWHCTIMLIYVY